MIYPVLYLDVVMMFKSSRQKVSKVLGLETLIAGLKQIWSRAAAAVFKGEMLKGLPSSNLHRHCVQT